jgi:GrpB-like predicted nucleotidyltransferase (UPF0157 family)
MEDIEFTENCWSNAETDVIEICAYNPQWPDLFKHEAAEVRAILPKEIAEDNKTRIEHFGSTAIPGLAAKPIIDIMLINDDTTDVWPSLVQPLQSLSYVYWAGNPRTDRMFFVKGMPPFGKKRSHHLHVRHSDDAQRELLFRDCLICDPDVAAQYETLKKNLAIRYRSDREAYTESKNEFVQNVLLKAGYFGKSSYP